MNYTREKLMNMPLNQIIDLVMQMQEQVQIYMAEQQSRMTIDRKMNSLMEEYQNLKEASGMMMGNTMTGIPETTPGKRGRKPYTPEQKAEAYQRQLQRQMEKYYANKEKQKTDTLPLDTE